MLTRRVAEPPSLAITLQRLRTSTFRMAKRCWKMLSLRVLFWERNSRRMGWRMKTKVCHNSGPTSPVSCANELQVIALLEMDQSCRSQVTQKTLITTGGKIPPLIYSGKQPKPPQMLRLQARATMTTKGTKPSLKMILMPLGKSWTLHGQYTTSKMTKRRMRT